MLGSIIGAGASLIGGILGNKNQQDQKQLEYQRQKEFAQKGIQWKVADAKKAGLHPLYALGGSTATYSPQAITSTDYGLGDMGQNIQRAYEAYQTKDQRAYDQSVQHTKDKLELEGLQLRNDNLRAQTESQMLQNSHLALANQPGTPPPFVPVTNAPRLGQSGKYNITPDEVVSSANGAPAVEAAPKHDTMYVRDEKGYINFYPSQDVQDYLSESLVRNILWNTKSAFRKPPNEFWHPLAVDYKFDPVRLAWKPIFEYPTHTGKLDGRIYR